MIDDPEIEARLARFRPARAPAGLRRRVLESAPRRPTAALRRWLLPLAGAAAAVIMYALAVQARGAAMSAPVDPSVEAEIQAISDQLGGGLIARYVARRVARAEMLDRERPVE